MLRAFGIYRSRDGAAIERMRRLSLITADEGKLINKYKVWLRTKLTPELRAVEDHGYYVDKTLFALGKYLKK